MAISRAPWMGSITVTNAAQNLWTLLSAISTYNPANKSPKAEYLSIQLDIASGASKLYIGNAAVTSAFCGVALYAGQAWQVPMVSNLLNLDQIYLVSDAASVQVNVAFVTR